MVTLLTTAVNDGSTSTLQSLFELKELWLKEVVVNVCQSKLRDGSCKLDKDTLLELSKTEIKNVFGQTFLFDSNLIMNTIDNFFTFKKRTQLVKTEFKILNKELVYFKKQLFSRQVFWACFSK